MLGLARLPNLPHGIPTDGTSQESHQAQSQCAPLDLLLQCRGGESLHDGLCWLRLHFDFLAKHHPCACLRCWLHAGLDSKEVWHIEDTVLLHFSCCNGHEAVKDLTANLLFQLVLFCNSSCQGTLCHGLAAACLHCLHGLHRLHGLHGHGAEEKESRSEQKS